MELTVNKAEWFYEDENHWNYQAAKNATRAIWNTEPDITCEGGRYGVLLLADGEKN